MSTITKQAVQAVADLKAGYTLGHADVAILNELARIALASLEAEPVAFVMADDLKDSSIISTPAYRDLGEAMERTVGDVVALYEIPPSQVSLEARDKLSNFIASQEPLGKDFEKVLAENIEGLYVPDNSAPPAPVSVPNLKPVGFLFVADDGAVAYSPADWPMKGFNLIGQIYGDVNACCAAMIQGDEPVTTANKLLDEFDFERFNDVVWLEAVASNPHMHSPTTSTIAMVALELNKRLCGGNSPVIPECSCHACRPVTFADSRFVVCPDCGNKRCPHANDHRNACTGSNEPGQEGSAYPAAPQQEA